MVHLIYRLDVGGLENGLVNLINALPVDRYRHAIVCMDDFTDFRRRIHRPDLEVYALHKRPGQDWGLYLRLWRLLRRLKPAIVHSRNLATLEGQLPAALAGVGIRIHGEHGWDVWDPGGARRRYRLLRRLYRPLIGHYIALSGELEDYLHRHIGVSHDRISRICNGVDSERFYPAPAGRASLPLEGFAPPDALVIGTVGRMQAVKDQLTLVRAFIRLLERLPAQRLRLVLVGDGPLKSQADALLRQAGVRELAWLAGSRDDVPELLRGLDLFVLPSLAEGISNTILEAMASGLPVVATRVGGNEELVVEGQTGRLVPTGDPQALTEALACYLEQPAQRRAHAQAARRRVESLYSLAAMTEAYRQLYDRLLERQPLLAGRGWT
ncbi:MAG: TIGR03088 family PEP-CTERM/XrtA system glycosyltransferase [Candidatus Competibacteraceae bacterium]|nr:TIGR03088 family PEP-CTERM/XrtA system glycosyltransferase [Candidatus Competibacteraceae bacterium]